MTTQNTLITNTGLAAFAYKKQGKALADILNATNKIADKLQAVLVHLALAVIKTGDVALVQDDIKALLALRKIDKASLTGWLREFMPVRHDKKTGELRLDKTMRNAYLAAETGDELLAKMQNTLWYSEGEKVPPELKAFSLGDTLKRALLKLDKDVANLLITPEQASAQKAIIVRAQNALVQLSLKA